MTKDEKQTVRKRARRGKARARKQKPTQSQGSTSRCPHCHAVGTHVDLGHPFPNGNRRMRCAACVRPFIDKAGAQ